MSSASEPAYVRGRYVPEPVRVVNWPLRDDSLRTCLAAGAMVLAALLAARASSSWIMGLLVLLTLAGSTWRLWIPVTFDFSSKGIVQTVLGRQRRIAWRQVARYQPSQGGVLLLGDPQRSLLSPLRGVFVGWQGQRVELLHLLEHYLDAPEAPKGSTTQSYRTDAGDPTSQAPSPGQ